MTTINFTMKDLDGIVMPFTSFVIRSESGDLGRFTTNANGEATTDLFSSSYPYYVAKEDGSTEQIISYKMFVPQSTTPLNAELLYVDLGKLSKGWNDKSLLALIEAKVVAVNAKNQAFAFAQLMGNSTFLQENINNINAVSSAVPAINTVVDNLSDITAVAGYIEGVSDNVDDVVAVAQNLNNINTLALSIENKIDGVVDGIKDLFIAGTDYTKNQSTSLTLRNILAKMGTVCIYFDGEYIHKDRYYTVGKTIYFGSVGNLTAIHSNKVEVQYEIPSQFTSLSLEDEAFLTGVQVTALQAASDAAQSAASAASAAGGVVNSAVLTNTQAFTGINTFTQPIAGKTNSQVSLTGNETIAGVKTFAEVPVIPNDSFSFSKLQNINTGRILGRVSAGIGDVEELSVLPADLFNDASHGSKSGGNLHATASTTVSGFMSAEDKIKLDSLNGTVNPNDVINAIASTTTAGGVGGYVFARLLNGSTAYAFGSTIAGSSLSPTSAVTSGTLGSGTFSLTGGGVLTGTWRCMGNLSNANIVNTFGDVVGSVVGATLWLRIA